VHFLLLIAVSRFFAALQMSISERLNALGVDKQPSAPPSSAQHPPKLDTLATLLSQALQCSDKKILNVRRSGVVP